MARSPARTGGARRTPHDGPPLRGVFLEWRAPPYPAGHWTPDLLALAGIDDPLARPGAPSVAISWAGVAAARPEVLGLAPSGFDPQRAPAQTQPVRPDIALVRSQHVWGPDWSAPFN